MIRRIIKIDEEKCNGCGACAAACHEGAIEMVLGKARLMREDYCDGLGDCLPTCPTGAITFEEREAPAYDHEAVMANKAKSETGADVSRTEESKGCPGHKAFQIFGHTGCPGSMAKVIDRQETAGGKNAEAEQDTGGDCRSQGGGPCPGARTQGTQGDCVRSACPPESRLSQWPVQIKLAPVKAGYFDGADLLIAADCTAYAYGDFHNTFMRNKITLIGCPKLDEVDYSEKLTYMLSQNDIKSVTIIRMEVPCCGGIELAVKKALQASGKFIPWQVITVSTDGKILDRI